MRDSSSNGPAEPPAHSDPLRRRLPLGDEHSVGLVLFRSSGRTAEPDASNTDASNTDASNTLGLDAALRSTMAGAAVEVLIGHMGGPFWAKKDDGAWSFPKGLVEPEDASADAVARREFSEELGVAAPDGPLIDLGVVSTGRKRIRLLAMSVDDLELDTRLSDAGLADGVEGGTFDMEWPPRSGRRAQFPEIDRAAWVPLGEAATKLSANQRPAIEQIAALAEVQPPS